jgi:hypothetical protein
MNSLFTILRDEVYGWWRQLREEVEPERYLPLLRPVAPYAAPPALSPVAMLGVLFALVVTSGVAIGALGVLLLASLVLYFLFTEVLGLTIEVRPLPF